MSRLRRVSHNRTRRTSRGLNRRCVRRLAGYQPGTPDLSEALRAYRRFLSCSRRLAGLAPAFFDSRTVDRAARDHEERRRMHIFLKPALDRVYGPSDEPPFPEHPPLPPLPGPAVQSVIESELAKCLLLSATARLALDRHRQRKPPVVSLSSIVSLLEVASALGRCASGMG